MGSRKPPSVWRLTALEPDYPAEWARHPSLGIIYNFLRVGFPTGLPGTCGVS